MQSGHGTGRAPRGGRLAGRWLVALLITGAVALLAPGVSYASSPPAPAPTAPAAADGCRGTTPAVFPARGFIADVARDQGGHLWWRGARMASSPALEPSWSSCTTPACRPRRGR